MIKLLNAGFTRLKKDKLFWGLTVVVIGFALIMLYNAYSDMLEYGGNVSVDEYFFNVGMLIGFAIAIFASVYLGNEYSNGTLRNKIVMGHNRIKIYLSNLIIVSIISVFWVLLFDFVTACIGIPLFGNIQMDIGKFLLLFVIVLLLSIAFASIFTFIAMVCSNKTATSIICLVTVFAMMFGSTMLFNLLSTPPTTVEYSMVDGQFVPQEVPNPRYPTDQERKIYQTILNIMPQGQAFSIVGYEDWDYKVLPFYSLGVIIIFTGAGLIIFKRKDLK
mgnify:FL=1